jgi:hypothetical protein
VACPHVDIRHVASQFKTDRLIHCARDKRL